MLVGEAVVEALVGLIYEAAVAPDVVPTMLAGLAALFNAPFADSYARSHDRSWMQGIVHGLDDADYRDGMLDEWSARNPWGCSAPVVVAGEVLSTRDMLPKEALVRTDMFNAYLDPRGLHEGLRISVRADRAGIEDVSLLRPFSAGPFGPAEAALGQRLLPHLQRAAALRQRLNRAEVTSQAALAGLDSVHHAVLLLDAGGRPVFLNAAAEALLAGEDGILLRGGQLAAATPALTTQLRAALDQAAGTTGTAGFVRLPRPSGEAALTLLAVPLRWNGAWPQSGFPGVIVCVSTGPTGGDERVQPQLMALFGLTPAEARLATDLLSGRDVTEVARLHGRSLATIRTHLSRVFAKTDTTRQSELMRLLLTVPHARLR